MNKFLLIFLLPMQIMAAESVVMLEAQTHHGQALEKHAAIIKDGKLNVDGEILSASEVITQSSSLAFLAKIEKQSLNRHCRAGQYRLLVKRDNKIEDERGCLESSRYSDLIRHFKNLKKDVITE